MFVMIYLIFGFVVDSTVFSLVIGHVDLETIEGPGDEDDVTLLLIKGEVTHIQSAVGLYDSRKHPENGARRFDDCKGIHEILEAVIGTVR